MDKEDVVFVYVCVCMCVCVCIYIYIHIKNGILLSHKKMKLLKTAVFNNMNGPEGYAL